MTENSVDDNEYSFSGKIAIVTTVDNEDNWHSVEHLVSKYGAEKILHVIWPKDFITAQKQMIDIIATLAADRDIKALIINQALPGTNAAIDNLKESRDDIYLVFCGIHESPPQAALRANLMFDTDLPGMGRAIVLQAKKQGAKVFVHYSFPRHMSILELSGCRNMIQKTCGEEDIKFVDSTAPDPRGEAGNDAAEQFIIEDVPKLVAMYGENTCFFCTNCSLQIPLIKAVVDNHAIFSQQCCPSPLHGFPEALGINNIERPVDLSYVISEIGNIAAEKNMTDRLSTWPVSASMMYTIAGAEYAIKCIKGEVPRNGINERVLQDCMSDYVKKVIGESVEVSMTSYSEGGKTYDKFKLLLMAYLDY